MNKILMWLGSTIMLIVCLAGLYLLAGSDDLFECVDTPITNESSPDGKYDAMIYLRGCGATTAEVIRIGVEKKGLFTSKKDILIIKGAHSFDLNWKDNKNLFIFSHSDIDVGNSDIFLLKKSVYDIHIHFAK